MSVLHKLTLNIKMTTLSLPERAFSARQRRLSHQSRGGKGRNRSVLYMRLVLHNFEWKWSYFAILYVAHVVDFVLVSNIKQSSRLCPNRYGRCLWVLHVNSDPRLLWLRRLADYSPYGTCGDIQHATYCSMCDPVSHWYWHVHARTWLYVIFINGDTTGCVYDFRGRM